MTPEPNHIDSERASARSLEPSAVLREIVDSWQLPDGNDSPAEEPCPDYADGPRFSLAELIDQQAMGYKAWGTGVGDFLGIPLWPSGCGSKAVNHGLEDASG